MRVIVEWQTEVVTTYRAEIEVPEDVLALKDPLAVNRWVDSDDGALAAQEDSVQPVRVEFLRDVVDWRGVEGTYGPEQRITVRLP